MGDACAVYPEVPENKGKCIYFYLLAARRVGSGGWHRLLSLLDGARGPQGWCYRKTGSSVG